MKVKASPAIVPAFLLLAFVGCRFPLGSVTKPATAPSSLPEGGRISGTVLQGASPVANERILSLNEALGQSPEQFIYLNQDLWRGIAVSDEHGRYEIMGLSGGTYDLLAGFVNPYDKKVQPLVMDLPNRQLKFPQVTLSSNGTANRDIQVSEAIRILNRAGTDSLWQENKTVLLPYAFAWRPVGITPSAYIVIIRKGAEVLWLYPSTQILTDPYRFFTSRYYDRGQGLARTTVILPDSETEKIGGELYPNDRPRITVLAVTDPIGIVRPDTLDPRTWYLTFDPASLHVVPSELFDGDFRVGP